MICNAFFRRPLILSKNRSALCQVTCFLTTTQNQINLIFRTNSAQKFVPQSSFLGFFSRCRRELFHFDFWIARVSLSVRKSFRGFAFYILNLRKCFWHKIKMDITLSLYPISSESKLHHHRQPLNITWGHHECASIWSYFPTAISVSEDRAICTPKNEGNSKHLLIPSSRRIPPSESWSL